MCLCLVLMHYGYDRNQVVQVYKFGELKIYSQNLLMRFPPCTAMQP